MPAAGNHLRTGIVKLAEGVEPRPPLVRREAAHRVRLLPNRICVGVSRLCTQIHPEDEAPDEPPILFRTKA